MGNCNFMAGIVRLEIVPEWSVERIRRAGGLASVELAEGAEWRMIAMEEGEYSETAGSGDAKSRTLRCTLSIGLGANLLREIELMAEERYVARVTDGRGVQWIVGDEQEPDDVEWSEPVAFGAAPNSPAIGRAMKKVPAWLSQGLPRPTKRKAIVSFKFFEKDTPLLRSGMMGPVVLSKIYSAK